MKLARNSSRFQQYLVDDVGVLLYVRWNIPRFRGLVKQGRMLERHLGVSNVISKQALTPAASRT